jgi:anti-anti-sigma regulatory factor
VLDLSSVTYLDSSGIRLLFQLEADLVTHGQRLVIIVPSGAPILRTLQAAGVIGSLVLASSTEAALALVSVHPEARVYPPEVRDGDGAA